MSASGQRRFLPDPPRKRNRSVPHQGETVGKIEGVLGGDEKDWPK